MWIEIRGDDAVLVDADNFGELHVLERTGLPEHVIDGILRSSAWGRLEGNVALVSIASLRARLPARPSRKSGLDAMVDYAAARGWVTPDGTHLHAHLERRTQPRQSQNHTDARDRP